MTGKSFINGIWVIVQLTRHIYHSGVINTGKWFFILILKRLPRFMTLHESSESLIPLNLATLLLKSILGGFERLHSTAGGYASIIDRQITSDWREINDKAVILSFGFALSPTWLSLRSLDSKKFISTVLTGASLALCEGSMASTEMLNLTKCKTLKVDIMWPKQKWWCNINFCLFVKAFEEIFKTKFSTQNS